MQLGDLIVTRLELAEVWLHTRLVGYYMCIAGIGFGFTAVGVAGAIDAEARDG